MLQVNRQIVYQPFDTFVIAVGTTPTPISTTITKQDLIDSFTLSLDSGAANNVFIGGLNVTITTGLELVRGAGPLEFVIENQAQHYEIQEPVVTIAETLKCAPEHPYSIPFVIWDLGQICLVAAAATNVRCAAFRSMFI